MSMTRPLRIEFEGALYLVTSRDAMLVLVLRT